jgi:hypothetical protein
MAEHIDDIFHAMATLVLSGKYTTHADARQKAMGLSYVTAEKEDLNREVAALMRRMYRAGLRDGVKAITYVASDGGIYGSYREAVDLRPYLELAEPETESNR